MNRKRVRLAQNFLKDSNLVKHLVEKSSIDRKDHVFEIGFGQGALTRQLALRANKVTALEIDPMLVLRVGSSLRVFASNITVLCGDVERLGIPLHCNKLFANIPFNLTSRILRMVFSAENVSESFLVMQNEAAGKYSGRPQETLVSLWSKPWFSFEVIHRFNREDFIPVPRVDAVLLRICRKRNCDIPTKEAASYRSFVSLAFRSTKPSLRLTMKRLFTYRQWKRLAAEIGFPRDASPTMLSYQEWLRLFERFRLLVPESKRHSSTSAYHTNPREEGSSSQGNSN